MQANFKRAAPIHRPFVDEPPLAILCDLDDTIFDFSACSAQALRRACYTFSLPFDQACYQAYRNIDDALWEGQRAGLYTVRQVMETRFVRWLEQRGTPADAHAFAQTYEAELGQSCVLEPGVRESLTSLARMCPLYAASNGLTAMQRKRLAKAGLLALFTDVFVSDAIGYEKPDIRFFQACLSKMKRAAGPSIWMIGDNVTADMAGARQAGLSTCFYARRYPGAEEVPADRSFHDFCELPLLFHTK